MRQKKPEWILRSLITLVALGLVVACGPSSTPAAPATSAPTKAVAALQPTQPPPPPTATQAPTQTPRPTSTATLAPTATAPKVASADNCVKCHTDEQTLAKLAKAQKAKSEQTSGEG